MTIENSRADAQFLTVPDEQHVRRFRQRDYSCIIEWQEIAAVVRYIGSLETRRPALSENELSAILSASLNSYMTTAERDCLRNLMRRVKAANPTVQPAPAPAPSPADEWAALTGEQRKAIQNAIDWCYAMAFEDDERALRALLAAHDRA